MGVSQPGTSSHVAEWRGMPGGSCVQLPEGKTAPCDSAYRASRPSHSWPLAHPQAQRTLNASYFACARRFSGRHPEDVRVADAAVEDADGDVMRPWGTPLEGERGEQTDGGGVGRGLHGRVTDAFEAPRTAGCAVTPEAPRTAGPPCRLRAAFTDQLGSPCVRKLVVLACAPRSLALTQCRSWTRRAQGAATGWKRKRKTGPMTDGRSTASTPTSPPGPGAASLGRRLLRVLPVALRNAQPKRALG